MTKVPTNTLEWGMFILENAPAGIKTLTELKRAFGEFFAEARKTHSGDATLEDLRASVRAKIDESKSLDTDIQSVDADGEEN